ncbi:MAG: Ni/Fe-hydrogenase cytochrome b subunit [Chloroflexi bacterium]|nr:Ni/Fe-hydrogenase cytochrome b subunit [Chloroflexota bacterium]
MKSIADPKQAEVRLNTPGTWLLVALVVVGVSVAALRLATGLGATTNLSDGVPWGLWIGFDVVAGVALAAGGFTLAAIVYIFGLEKYRPVVRPAILTAFLGYILVAVGIVLDIGRPYRIWHPIVFWQEHSVMFEVAWCVMLYLSVLALEFSSSIWEKLRLARLVNFMRMIIIPLVILGITLSTLHQSSLGSLFLITPELSPLWYTSLLPYLFFISAVGIGLAMVIFESFISAKVFKQGLEMKVLTGLARAAVFVWVGYLAIRFWNLIATGRLWDFTWNAQGALFLVETGVGMVLPVLILSIARLRNSPGWLFGAASLLIGGAVLNRLNTSLLGFPNTWQVGYFPSWMEFAVTIGLVSAALLAFKLAVKYTAVFAAYAHKPSTPGLKSAGAVVEAE